MNLKHRITLLSPDIKRLEDKNIQDVFSQLTKQIYDQFKNVYDDLIRLAPERVATLPTATSEILGRIYLKINTGAIDTFHLCVYDESDSSYKFKQITLS